MSTRRKVLRADVLASGRWRVACPFCRQVHEIDPVAGWCPAPCRRDGDGFYVQRRLEVRKKR
jgi:hypothetical protein